MKQGTPEWHEARRGKLTASRLADVIAKVKSGGASASRAAYLAQLVAERITGRVEDGYTSDAMRHGTANEAAARSAYECEACVFVIDAPFVDHPTIAMSGASPDGFVGSDGLIEIKCPNTNTHIDTLLRRKVPEKHMPQIQWQLACTGRQWCDFVSFDPRMPADLQLFIRRVPRDDALIAEYESEVLQFLQQVHETFERLLMIHKP